MSSKKQPLNVDMSTYGDSQPQTPQPFQAAALGFPTQIPTGEKKQGLTDFANLSPEQAKASMGMATRMMEHLLPQAPQMQNSAIMGQQMPEQPNDSDEKVGALKTELEAKLRTLEESTKGHIQKEISSIKDLIIQALSEDGE